MQLIGLVMILLYVIRNILRMNVSLAVNSVRSFSMVLGFALLSVYYFGQSLFKAKEFVIGCAWGENWIYHSDDPLEETFLCTEAGFM